MPHPAPPIGALLRDWRQRRRRSQLDLALDAAVSTRHLSYVESGRARPSREMVLRLAEQLEVPLRARNALLLAAGYAPAYPDAALEDPAMAGARQALAMILAAQAPNPALAVDRHWHLVAANAVLPKLLAGLAEPALLAPPVNVLRLSLHPGGLAPRIGNLPEWRAHILERLRRQLEASGDPVLEALRAELLALPAPPLAAPSQPSLAPGGVVVPLLLESPAGRLTLLGTTTVFGTAMEVTLSELAIESFYPADPVTASRLAALG
ncbi:helix-turn-helix domain-containing protein [Falsiroseomonas selenitidurans]|uniref:Helix-turn-helix transcriptional regulator n=1 Tax=Falsiroseomonas selenitidurans TaxID=2716335 RepID=A0ABX1E706_9PROT|nr:helix-turn-helix transcriptional regulator [Falsiroseomonas selenitidurans]NKC31572.1 helix-turn-helix transcriptional regulator [Falsiroseomonas selenitidurans]